MMEIIDNAMEAAKAAFAGGRDPADPTARAEAAEAELAKLKDGLADLGYVENAGPEDATTTVDKALTALRDVSADRESLGLKIDDLRNQRDAETARAEAAEAKTLTKVSRAQSPAKPRAIGAMADGKALSGSDLRAAIAAADKIEIAFSDGKKEIGAADPVIVEGEVWRDHMLGLMLKEPVTMKGPSGPPSYAIDGYALLLDGKQVAYCKRSDPLTVAPGQTISIADDIYF